MGVLATKLVVDCQKVDRESRRNSSGPDLQAHINEQSNWPLLRVQFVRCRARREVIREGLRSISALTIFCIRHGKGQLLGHTPLRRPFVGIATREALKAGHVSSLLVEKQRWMCPNRSQELIKKSSLRLWDRTSTASYLASQEWSSPRRG